MSQTAKKRPSIDSEIVGWHADGPCDGTVKAEFDDAVLEFLEDLDPEELLDMVEKGETVTVDAYRDAKVVAGEGATQDILEGLLEHLDVEYGDFDGPATEPSERMLERARAFVRDIEAMYVPWRCEIIEGVFETVNVGDWMRQFEPQRLAELCFWGLWRAPDSAPEGPEGDGPRDGSEGQSPCPTP